MVGLAVTGGVMMKTKYLAELLATLKVCRHINARGGEELASDLNRAIWVIEKELQEREPGILEKQLRVIMRLLGS